MDSALVCKTFNSFTSFMFIFRVHKDAKMHLSDVTKLWESF